MSQGLVQQSQGGLCLYQCLACKHRTTILSELSREKKGITRAKQEPQPPPGPELAAGLLDGAGGQGQSPSMDRSAFTGNSIPPTSQVLAGNLVSSPTRGSTCYPLSVTRQPMPSLHILVIVTPTRCWDQQKSLTQLPGQSGQSGRSDVAKTPRRYPRMKTRPSEKRWMPGGQVVPQVSRSGCNEGMETFARLGQAWWAEATHLPQGCAVTRSQAPTSLGLPPASQPHSSPPQGRGRERLLGRFPGRLRSRAASPLLSRACLPSRSPGRRSLALVSLPFPTPNVLPPQAQRQLGPEGGQSPKWRPPRPEASNQSSGSQLNPRGSLLLPVSKEMPCW